MLYNNVNLICSGAMLYSLIPHHLLSCYSGLATGVYPGIFVWCVVVCQLLGQSCQTRQPSPHEPVASSSGLPDCCTSGSSVTTSRLCFNRHDDRV